MLPEVSNSQECSLRQIGGYGRVCDMGLRSRAVTNCFSAWLLGAYAFAIRLPWTGLGAVT